MRASTKRGMTQMLHKYGRKTLTFRDRFPRTQGTGPNADRDLMTGKLKSSNSGGAFGKGRGRK